MRFSPVSRLLVMIAVAVGWASVATATAQVDPSEPRPPTARHTNRSQLFSLVLPADWRQITPDEARTLRASGSGGFSRDLLDPKPAEFYPYGNVDRWLADKRFDGRCMSVIVSDGEPAEGDEALTAIRQYAAEYTQAGRGSYEILASQWTQVGPDAHPAIECLSRRQTPDDARPIRLLELFAPSGGRTIVLAWRAFDDDFDAAEPVFREAADSLRFAREPRGQRDLSNDIIYIAVIGAIVGLLLAVMRGRGRTPLEAATRRPKLLEVVRLDSASHRAGQPMAAWSLRWYNETAARPRTGRGTSQAVSGTAGRFGA